MKKVLILTYYWPPSGGAGVQRWLKFVKYLPQFDIQPIVYTHSNGEAPSIDHSLEREIPDNVEILTTKIWEPYNVYKQLTGKKNEKINSGFLTESKPTKSFIHDTSIWVRGNFFIPDARKFWIKPSVKFLSQYIKEKDIDAIISTGPPHSMHLIAQKLKLKFNLKWIADFRDPWTNIDFYEELKLTSWADKKHKRLERKVLEQADVCISVGDTLSNELEVLGANKCITITNGYDESDVVTGDIKLDDKVSIAHIGSFTKSRNPELLLKALGELKKDYPNLSSKLELKLVGKVDYTITELISQYNVTDLVRKIDYLAHDEVLLEQRKSHLLLLVVNDTPNAKGILTGKVFEYLSAKRPILALAPHDGDLAKLIRKTNSGVVVDSSNEEEIVKLLRSMLANETTSFEFNNIENYSRKKLTKQLSEIIHSLASE